MLLFFVPTPEANLTSGTLVIFDKKIRAYNWAVLRTEILKCIYLYLYTYILVYKYTYIRLKSSYLRSKRFNHSKGC